jgi:hypothetical protein
MSQDTTPTQQCSPNATLAALLASEHMPVRLGQL